MDEVDLSRMQKDRDYIQRNHFQNIAIQTTQSIIERCNRANVSALHALQEQHQHYQRSPQEIEAIIAKIHKRHYREAIPHSETLIQLNRSNMEEILQPPHPNLKQSRQYNLGSAHQNLQQEINRVERPISRRNIDDLI
jgi:hypothetical protein